MQTVASFLDQSLAITAPLLTAGANLAPERIGNISSLSSLGTVLFLLVGGPLLARLGPVRMLQLGALTAAVGILVASSGWWPMLILAGLLMGIGYGPSPPAGSQILAATAPPQHRALIFSVKQAGAPLGGALAGLVLAPTAAAWGWPTALLISMLVGLSAAILVIPARERLDVEREPKKPIGLSVLMHPQTLAGPFLLLRNNPGLLSVTALAFSFAIVQGSLFSFSVTYLVTDRDLALTDAGLVYASMQFAGVFARVFLGWLADRTGRPAYNLTAQAFIAAALVVLYGSLPESVSTGLAALAAGATGFFAASWNGIFLAEVARLSPAGSVAQATASSALLTFLGYAAGPSLFSVLVTLSGEFQLAFLVVAAQLGAMATCQAVLLARRPP
jgi:MFS family permease